MSDFFSEYMDLEAHHFDYGHEHDDHVEVNSFAQGEFDAKSLITLQFKHILGIIDR